jgi:hypothetical protein
VADPSLFAAELVESGSEGSNNREDHDESTAAQGANGDGEAAGRNGGDASVESSLSPAAVSPSARSAAAAARRAAALASRDATALLKQHNKAPVQPIVSSPEAFDRREVVAPTPPLVTPAGDGSGDGGKKGGTGEGSLPLLLLPPPTERRTLAAASSVPPPPPALPAPPAATLAEAPKRPLFDASDSSDEDASGDALGPPPKQAGAAAAAQPAQLARPPRARALLHSESVALLTHALDASDDEGDLRLTMSWLSGSGK